MHSNDLIDTRKAVIAALTFFIIHRGRNILLHYDKTKKNKRINSLYRHRTTSQFVCSSHFEFQVLVVNCSGVWNQDVYWSLGSPAKWKIRSLAENICHVLGNSKKIFRVLDFTAAAHVTITTAKQVSV